MTGFTAAAARCFLIEGNARAGMHVDGSLDLGETTVTSLPADLSFGGSLYLNGSAITALAPRTERQGLRLPPRNGGYRAAQVHRSNATQVSHET